MIHNNIYTMSYIDKTPYKLINWVNINKLSWIDLNENPRAIYLLKKNKHNDALKTQ